MDKEELKQNGLEKLLHTLGVSDEELILIGKIYQLERKTRVEKIKQPYHNDFRVYDVHFKKPVTELEILEILDRVGLEPSSPPTKLRGNAYHCRFNEHDLPMYTLTFYQP